MNTVHVISNQLLRCMGIKTWGIEIRGMGYRDMGY